MRLIGLLNAAQQRHGFLSPDTLRALAKEANVPLYRLQQLVSFYPSFRTTSPPRVELAVCRDMSCYLAGAESCAKYLRELAGDDLEVKEVSCIGRCDRAPVGMLNHEPVPVADFWQVAAWVTGVESVPHFDQPAPSKWQIDVSADYAAIGKGSSPEEVIAALKESGLRGMGGAGFPAGVKWELVRKESRTPKYVICNADESEPGTFKDAKILADVPHLVLEGMMLAGHVVGATRGIVYLRHEYEVERKRLAAAIEKARSAGLLNDSFDIEIFVSPGGYILGEETALLEALEDRRGEPRNKPPFPGTHGLNGQPTLINNVETFANVPGIVLNGGAWWKARGKDGCAGLKFIAVSGHVEKPGVYEVPLGTTVRELIELAGGMKDGRKLLAFAPGGASSNFLPADKVDVKLDFAELAKAGSMLGSGAVVVVAEGTDLLALAANVTKFFRNESCGKCVPCRVGSEKAVELLDAVLAGKAPRTALDVLPDLGETMALTSICGLGQVAVAPALSVLKNFPNVLPS
jgi:NADH:ubiquinone oxidoreductase subunit F (NADH-binding)/NADH:ubiquinone oxidoreductase subunit E